MSVIHALLVHIERDDPSVVQTVRSELVWRFNWAGPVTARY
jgi:hypothetical protein